MNIQVFYTQIIIVPPTLLFTKLSLYLLYLQIFRPNTSLKWAIYSGSLITTLFYTTVSIAQFIIVRPTEAESFVQQAVTMLSLALGAFGVISDLYILILPLFGVLKLQMSLRRKIGVVLIFMTGLLYEYDAIP